MSINYYYYYVVTITYYWGVEGAHSSHSDNGKPHIEFGNWNASALRINLFLEYMQTIHANSFRLVIDFDRYGIIGIFAKRHTTSTHSLLSVHLYNIIVIILNESLLVCFHIYLCEDGSSPLVKKLLYNLPTLSAREGVYKTMAMYNIWKCDDNISATGCIFLVFRF